jgi:carbonic anhydrase/acetyltransferase-like protein (isoleucine patch superfamily)
MTPPPYPVPTMLRVGHAYVASTASVVSDVTLGVDVNVWYGAVVRGDDAPLSLGDRTNFQDGALMHADTGVRNDVSHDVTVGHGAILHGTKVEAYVLVGMGSVLLAGSVIGEGAVVAAGCVVPEGFVVPPYSLVVGVPARVVKTLDRGPRREEAIIIARDYVQKARDHLEGRWASGPRC